MLAACSLVYIEKIIAPKIGIQMNSPNAQSLLDLWSFIRYIFVNALVINDEEGRLLKADD